MKKKIINANTMEVLMNRNDLKKYKITVLDLLGDHEHVQNFFYRLLTRIDDHHQFSTHGHLIFKILPSKDGLELIISKHASHSALRFRSKGLKNPSGTERNRTFSRDNIIKFKSFEDVIKVAHLISMDKGAANLYLLHGQYYLELRSYLTNDRLNKNKIENKLSMAYEYGVQVRLSHAFLSQNGKEIMKGNALGTVNRYFK